MLKIDSVILDTNKVICSNSSKFDASERVLLSQNLLSQLRNFVEYIFIKAYVIESEIDLNDVCLRKQAIKDAKT